MEQLDSRRFHTLTPQTKRLAIILGLLFALVIVPVVGYVYYETALERPAQGHKEATFEIFEGEAIASIAERLVEEELINSDFLFRVHLFAKGLHTRIQAGVYRIPAGASVAELAQLFQYGTNDISITFIEGWRVEEYARAASEQFSKVDYDRFVELAKEHEGFLFPDTYFFTNDADEQEIIDRLLVTFDSKTADLLTTENLADAGLTKEEAVNFASIVEREVHSEDDRPIVAGILIKRWESGELIGADATSQYAIALEKVCTSAQVECPTNEQALVMEWWPETLTSADLEFDSPYNTRKNVGLPPTPIASPGLSALDAVLNFIETSYNYYLTDENGVTRYANTLEEHNRNVAQYL